MNSFIKYFIHLMLISLCFIICIVFIQTFVYKDSCKTGFVIVLFVATIIYSIPMAIYSSSAAKLSLVKISSEIANDKALDEYIAMLKRYPVEIESERKVYRAKNKYTAWLTNEVVVYKDGEGWFISLPNAYVNKLKKKFELS